MPFERVVKWRGPDAPLRSEVKVKCFNRGTTEVLITHDVHEKMGHPTHVEVFHGVGRDAGKIMLVPSSNRLNAYRLGFTKPHIRLVLNSVKMGWPVVSTRKVAVPFIFDEETLIVDFDPTTVAEVAAIRPRLEAVS